MGPGASPAEVWSGYRANLERLDLLLLAPLASGRVRADFLRNHWTCATIGPGATQQLVKRAEKVTVQNALRTWAEFEGFLQQRGRSFPPESGISASQAMVNRLERRIVQMFEAGEERWSALLGGWLVMSGVLRYKHGKQKKLRQGFSFIIPSTFLSGFPWAEVFLEAWKALPRAAQRTSARDGRPWALSEVNLVLRTEFHSYLEDADALSTYSFRRVAPTLGSLLKFTGKELCALGDWQDRSQLGEESRMPMHYSGARYLLSFKQKFVALQALKTLQDYTGWEGIPTVQLEPSKKAGRSFQARDEVIIWAAPPNMEEAQALTASLGVVIKEIYAARDANWAVGVQEPQIATTQAAPATASKAAASTNLLTQGKPIGGRPVARTMRDGTQIQHGKGKCMQGVRRCGVVIRGDRVCGLGHAAKDCTGGNAACAWVLEEIEQLEVRGGASIRENPARSLHWALPQEQRELEWEPVECAAGRFYPSKEEAEYTAPLCSGGIHCGGDDWLPHDVAYIHQSGRMTLVCDCPMEASQESSLGGLGGIPGAQALPRNLQKHSQELLVARFRRLFPHEWLQRTTCPMIEDLVNSFPFSTFTEWCEDQELDVDGPMGPVLATRTARFRQAGEPTPDEHFDHAWHRRQMIDLRRQAVGALRELKQRWQGVTATLRERQPATSRRGPAGRMLKDGRRGASEVAEEAAQFRAPPAPNIDGKRDIPALGLVQSSQPACLRGLLEEESGETNVVSTAT
ncbi:unnamed protein product [Effrenium voratum]|nr:unnamed protein product [Effrenium voratum]